MVKKAQGGATPEGGRKASATPIIICLSAICVLLAGVILNGLIEPDGRAHVQKRSEKNNGGGGKSTSSAPAQNPAVQPAATAAVSRPPASASASASASAAAGEPAPAPAPAAVSGEEQCSRLQTQANVFYRRGDFQAAVDSLIECTELLPGDVDVVWDVGVMLSQLRDYAAALSWMRAAINLEVNSSTLTEPNPRPVSEKSPLATENLLENTDGVPSVFFRDGSLLPSIYADGRYIDAVIVS